MVLMHKLRANILFLKGMATKAQKILLQGRWPKTAMNENDQVEELTEYYSEHTAFMLL